MLKPVFFAGTWLAVTRYFISMKILLYIMPNCCTKSDKHNTVNHFVKTDKYGKCGNKIIFVAINFSLLFWPNDFVKYTKYIFLIKNSFLNRPITTSCFSVCRGLFAILDRKHLTAYFRPKQYILQHQRSRAISCTLKILNLQFYF